MSRPTLALAVLISLVVASPGLSAEEGWRLRFFGFYMETGDTPTIVDSGGTALSSDNGYGAGIGASAEYRLNPRLGLGLGLARADHGDFFPDLAPLGATVEATSTMHVNIVTAGLNVHLRPESSVDIYFGTHLALVDYGSFDIRVEPMGQGPGGPSRRGSVSVDTDLGFGLELGLDLPLDENWIFHANLRYLLTSIEGGGVGATMESVDYDPLLIGVGFGFRF